jgi:hypothetical protein
MKKKNMTFPDSVSTASRTARPSPSREDIARRAEALWVQKGCPVDSDEQIWLEAERQLKAGSGTGQNGGEPAEALPLSRLNLNSDEVMSELGELFPERSSGKETTSL